MECEVLTFNNFFVAIKRAAERRETQANPCYIVVLTESI